MDEAKDQLNWSFSKHHSVETVQQELDPFLNEARAFENIDKICPIAYKKVFPTIFWNDEGNKAQKSFIRGDANRDPKL